MTVLLDVCCRPGMKAQQLSLSEGGKVGRKGGIEEQRFPELERVGASKILGGVRWEENVLFVVLGCEKFSTDEAVQC
jgi:hypothetical protein